MTQIGKYAKILCPFPTVSADGVLTNGGRLGQCQFCQKCKTKDCKGYRSSSKNQPVEHRLCPYGLSVFVVHFEWDVILINGLVEPELNRESPKRIRRTLRSHFVRIDQVIEWRAVILRVLEEIGRDIDVGVKESISSLHDINTAVSLVYRNAEGLIDESPGLDLDEKVENADPKLKSLWKSVSLLTTRMNMASIVANPEACRFGKKRPSPIYKVFDKMCHLFEGPASQKHVRIRIMGRSFNSPPAYDSIESLALVLVDNAVKYCLPDMEVIVRVNDLEADFPGVAVEVESVGPLVPIDEQEAIFLKGFRCPNAQQFAAGGSGLGLYIARLIADAHGLKLEYRGVSTTGDQSVGRNTFSFRIR